MLFKRCMLALCISSLARLMDMFGRMTYAWVNCVQTSSDVRSAYHATHSMWNMLTFWYTMIDPVTAAVPSQDGQTYLATTLDGHVRLMDAQTGKMLNGFSGHVNSSYRCRACFGHGEASVICGDEKGMVWAWDLLDVRRLIDCSSHVVCSHDYRLLALMFVGQPPTAESPTQNSRQGDHMD